MPFDKLDKKAREAAENYKPAYNEAAWDKMEALLDKHMPLEDSGQQTARKKHPEMWLFLLLCMIGGLFVTILLIPQKHEDQNSVVTTGVENKALPRMRADKTPPTKGISGSGLKTDQGVKTGNLNSAAEKDELTPRGSKSTTQNTQNSAPSRFYKSALKAHVANDENPDQNISNTEEAFNTKATNQADPTAQQINTPTQLIHQQISNEAIGNKKIIANTITLSDLSKTNGRGETDKSRPTQQNRNKFGNSFSLNLSAGPDVSAISIDNTGRLNLLVGVGVAYEFGKRWQLRTGFYTVKKVYNANPADYAPPANFWYYYPNLEDISADCRVNEIPLIVNYTFNQSVKHSWFVSVGASSYFMKRETYNYISKLPSGQYQEKLYTIRNENNHYFSSLRLSAGYEKKFGNAISFSTEPYMNLPLNGIGYGKVKLKSAGVLFTISVKPFTKK